MPDEQVTLMLEELDRHTSNLESVAIKLSNCVEPFALGFQQKGLIDNIKLYALVSYIQDVAKEMSRVANVVEPVLAERITKRMQQEDMESLDVAGHTYKPSDKTYVSVSEGKRDVIIKWLKGHDAGKELVREDFNANAFKSFVERELDSGKQVHPDVNVFSKPTLSVRKVRGK